MITELSRRRPVFASEADFQLELAWLIKEKYTDAEILLEYCPSFDSSMHIDILVIIDGCWIPIELKYKTKGCTIKHSRKENHEETYNLAKQDAKNINCYLYLNDIMRIEKVRKEKADLFLKGYTVMITNDKGYQKSPSKKDTCYEDFAIADDTKKTGELNWAEKTSAKTKERYGSIALKDEYLFKWKDYSTIPLDKIDNPNANEFIYLLNEIK